MARHPDFSTSPLNPVGGGTQPVARAAILHGEGHMIACHAIYRCSKAIARLHRAFCAAGRWSRAPAAWGQSEAESLSSSFRKAAKRVLPAVVTVRVDMPPVEILGAPRLVPFVAPVNPGGSGVVIDSARGLVLTNDHVVVGGPRVVVVLPDGQSRLARSVRRDPKSDLALVVIDPDGLKAAEWGDSDALEQGDWVLAVGQPFGLSAPVTAGIVSGKARGIGLGALRKTSLSRDRRRDRAGELRRAVGESQRRGRRHQHRDQDLGRRPRRDRFRPPLVSGQARGGRPGGIRAGAQGVPRVGNPTGGSRDGRSAGECRQAVAIYAVAPRGPGTDAGLRAGDLIAKLRGRPISGIAELQAAIEIAPIGAPLELTILREGEEKTVTVDVRSLQP